MFSWSQQCTYLLLLHNFRVQDFSIDQRFDAPIGVLSCSSSLETSTSAPRNSWTHEFVLCTCFFLNMEHSRGTLCRGNLSDLSMCQRLANKYILMLLITFSWNLLLSSGQNTSGTFPSSIWSLSGPNGVVSTSVSASSKTERLFMSGSAIAKRRSQKGFWLLRDRGAGTINLIKFNQITYDDIKKRSYCKYTDRQTDKHSVADNKQE